MLIKCPECGKEVSDRASSCIHCGYPLQATPQQISTASAPMDEHYHCPLCSVPYPTEEEATNCFLQHTENEILRYIAFEIFSSKHFAKNKKKPQPVDYTVWMLIEQLNEKFDFAEVDDGAVWNKSIRGKKI